MNQFKYQAILLLLLLVGCRESQSDNTTFIELDYSQPELWFEREAEMYSSDVFYILPTCIWDWSDDDGVIQNYADPFDAEQRELMRPSYELAAEIFGAECNYFAPYYRQISLNSWMEGDSVVNQRFPTAMTDINDAFKYFIEEKSEGRPFILAGFSQGGKGVVELLKSMPDSLIPRMVAAYVVGYRVLEEEIERYEAIVPATNATDIGVTISYNSVESASGISSVLSPTAAVINPISWRTDSEYATVDEGVTVHIDSSCNMLFVEGLDSDAYFIPELMSLLPLGNYHLQELTLYQASLSQNVKDRVTTYTIK